MGLGIIILIAFSCKAPTVSGVVESCVTSQQYQVSKCGNRIIDYTQKREVVGEWQDITKLVIKPLAETPDQVCFSLDNWLTKIKPKLKEGSDFSHNQKTGISPFVDNEKIKAEDL